MERMSGGYYVKVDVDSTSVAPKAPPDTLPSRFIDHCCRQDTLGMVKLPEKMRELAGNRPR
jgi:hypothetical protein